jgi:hypothetical protein
MPCTVSGTMMRRSTPGSEQPSISAAFSISIGTASMKPIVRHQGHCYRFSVLRN